MLDAMFLIQRSLYLRLKQTRHPHGIMDLYVGSFWGNRQWGYCVGKNNVTFPIPFNSVWTVLGNAHGSNNSNNDHYFPGEFSTTGARFYYSNMNLTGTAWIAIGDC